MRRFRQLEWWRVPAAILALIGIALVGVALGQDIKDAPRATGYRPMNKEVLQALHAAGNAKYGVKLAMMAKNLSLPPSFDCRAAVPLAIWDQGSCGSCYLVSEVRTATCAGIFAGLGKADNTFILSSQFGMDRPRNFGGCNGGNGTEVIAWMLRNGWVAERYIDAQGVSHSDYPPYEARTGSDRTKAGAKKDWVVGWEWAFVSNTGKLTTDSSGGYHLSAPAVEQVKAALYKYGRLNIALDAGGGFNAGGTITSLGRNIDHEINMAGYDDNHDNGNGTKGAFLLENQWGDGWSGAGAGPGCKWCSYAAAQNIVDHHFISAGAPAPPPVQAVVVSPGAVTLAPGGRQQFAATTDGTVQPVTWTASGGVIDVGGLYSAGSATGSFIVVASSKADPTKYGVAMVTISTAPPPPPPPIGGLTITLGTDTPKGTYELAPPGTTARIGELQRNIEEIEAIIKRMKAERQKPVPPPPPEKKPSLEETQTQEPPASVPVPSVEELAAKRAKLKWNPDRQPKRDPKTGRILQK